MTVVLSTIGHCSMTLDFERAHMIRMDPEHILCFPCSGKRTNKQSGQIRIMQGPNDDVLIIMYAICQCLSDTGYTFLSFVLADIKCRSQEFGISESFAN